MNDTYFGATDAGLQRQNNEDAFFVHPLSDKGFVAACVIDGVGGYEGGEIAAEIAHDALLQHLKTFSAPAPAALQEAMASANKKIMAAKDGLPQLGSMACVVTLALVDAKANQAFYIHVGDTRLYLFRDGSLIKVTKDQSFVGFLEDGGKLSEQEAMRHPKRNEIDKALGFEPNLGTDYFDAGNLPFLPGDLLLLCSDGLTDMIDAATITNLLTASVTLEEKCKLMIDAANAAGGRDNITVVLVQHPQRRSPQKALKPKRSKPSTTLPVATDVVIDDDKIHAEKQEAIFLHPAKQSGKNTAIIGLSVLCLSLVVALAYVLWPQKRANGTAQPIKQLSPSEQALAQLVNTFPGDTLFIPDSITAAPVAFLDAIFLKKDTVRINGLGLKLIANAGFNGPAFVLDSACRFLLLEDVTFQDFNSCIIANGQTVQLKNVRFIKCGTSVQYSFSAQDTVVQHYITDSLFRLPASKLK